jgi:hypothetical protein
MKQEEIVDKIVELLCDLSQDEQEEIFKKVNVDLKEIRDNMYHEAGYFC